MSEIRSLLSLLIRCTASFPAQFGGAPLEKKDQKLKRNMWWQGPTECDAESLRGLKGTVVSQYAGGVTVSFGGGAQPFEGSVGPEDVERSPAQIRKLCRSSVSSSKLMSSSKEDLSFVDENDIKPGTRVMLVPDLKAPAFGWGGVTFSMVGIFLRYMDCSCSLKCSLSRECFWLLGARTLRRCR